MKDQLITELTYRGKVRKTKPKNASDIARRCWDYINRDQLSVYSLMMAGHPTDDEKALFTAVGAELGLCSPTGEKGTVITVDGDTVIINNYYAPGRGSLGQVFSRGLAEKVNTLGWNDCAMLLQCVEVQPFPYGKYREVLQAAKDFDFTKSIEAVKTKFTLGEFRKYIANRALGGINAPMDSYLDALIELKSE